MALEPAQNIDGLLTKKYTLPRAGTQPIRRSVTEVGSFRPERAITGESEYHVERMRRQPPSIREFLGHVERPALPPFIVPTPSKREELPFAVFGTSGTHSALQTLEIAPKARQRLMRYERLAHGIYSIVREQLAAFGTCGTIQVRPAWSHEYEESTGVVIDVTIAADDNLRFLLWDSVSEKVAELRVSQDEKAFLQNNISLLVTTRDRL
jgi:hypothetical protein